MSTTFCALLTAYLLATFVLPTRPAIKHARPILHPLLHAAVAALAACLLLGAFHWPIPAAILAAFFVLAAIEARRHSDSAASFLAGQCLRLAVLLGLAFYFPGAARDGWTAGIKPDLSKWYFAVLSCVSGIILCVPAGGVLIARLIAPLHNEICDQDITGLKQGGRYIGWLERILVMLLVLVDQPNGTGFLITAKSILRFGEIKDANQRKVAEYIIIGTFLSFGWALLISELTQKTIQYWIH